MFSLFALLFASTPFCADLASRLQYPPGAHVSDLVDLYGAIIEHILQDQAIPSGRDGYYSAQAHKLPWWAYMEALAKSLHARGLVVDSELATWPSDAAAAQALRFPQAYIRAMGIAR